MARVLFSPEAMEDVLVADEWWRQHRLAAVDLFAAELASVTATLAVTPLVGARSRRDDTRRVAMRRTRSVVYFRVAEDGDAVHILRVWHMSRGSPPTLP